MKSLIRLPFTLLLLLLVGFTQVFAPMYGAMTSNDPQHDHVRAPHVKVPDIEKVENEEEFKRNVIKEPTRDNADFVYGHLVQLFIQHLKNQSSFTRYSSCISLFTSPPDRAFDILRL